MASSSKDYGQNNGNNKMENEAEGVTPAQESVKERSAEELSAIHAAMMVWRTLAYTVLALG